MLIGIGFWPSVADAGPNKLPQTVREGLDLFKKGQLTEASERLDAAEGDCPRKISELCSTTSQGALVLKWPRANGTRRPSCFALRRWPDDTQLSIWCNYNLGQIDIERVRAEIGEKPEELQKEVRANVLTWLGEAQNHYRGLFGDRSEF